MPPEPSGELVRNLAALSLSSPALATQVGQSEPNPHLAFRQARNGGLVPVLRRAAGDLPLHSLVDPEREAERLLESIGNPGFLVCFGLGGGFLPAVFLRQPQAVGLLVVEKDLPTLRALLGNLPLSSVLADQRTRLTVGTEEIRGIVRSSYLPAIAGDLSSLPLRPWCNAEEEFFGKAAMELSGAAGEASGDYAVQARFGKRWFANIMLNLPAAQGSSGPPIPARLAHVTAAGPSLEEQLRTLGNREKGSIIVATDTSLPALLRSGFTPEIVVSLDCQLYSYHHFLLAVPPETTLFFDLASPPFLVRRAGPRARFFTSAHPLSRFIAARWRPFPLVDTTGGNVTHAAVSLARALGIPDIRLHGADFSYPRGKPYARGTYLYDYFQERQLRCTPLESSLSSFVLGSPGLTRERANGGMRFSTPMLLDYKERLERLIGMSTGSQGLERFQDAPPSSSWREFLRAYGGAIRGLPGPKAPVGRYFTGLRAEQRELWSTLLPIAACVLRETGGSADRDLCLELSRQWALERTDRMIASEGQAQ